MTLEEMVRDQLHSMFEKNWEYENSANKEDFITDEVEALTPSELLGHISYAIERIRA